MGVHAMKALELRDGFNKRFIKEGKRRYNQRPNLEFLDGGVLDLNLLPSIAEASHLLILDAIECKKRTGNPYRNEKG